MPVLNSRQVENIIHDYDHSKQLFGLSTSIFFLSMINLFRENEIQNSGKK